MVCREEHQPLEGFMAPCEERREHSTEGLAPEVTWSSPARGGSPLENGSQGLCMDAAGTSRFTEGPGNAKARKQGQASVGKTPV